MSILILPPECSTCSFKSEVPHTVLPCDQDSGLWACVPVQHQAQTGDGVESSSPTRSSGRPTGLGWKLGSVPFLCDFGQVRQAL